MHFFFFIHSLSVLWPLIQGRVELFMFLAETGFPIMFSFIVVAETNASLFAFHRHSVRHGSSFH